MKRKNQNRTSYPYKRRVSPASYRRSTPSPSNRRPTPSPSYRRPTPSPSNRRPIPSSSYRRPIPSPSYRRSTSSPVYGIDRSPPPSYKTTGPRINKNQKIGVVAFSLMFTTIGLFGAFSILNPTSISTSTSTPTEKIAAFFWASDAGTQGVIDEYIDILTDEGYTKFFNFRNTNNFESDFQQVEDYEGINDIVFFYIIGHGYNDGQHSHTAFAPSSNVVSSNEFRQKCDTLDSSRVGLLIESCESGDWSDDMRGGGYLAISTSDEHHSSYAVGGIPGEGLFSDAFFDEVVGGSNAIDAFSVAENLCKSSQYPKLCDESAYDFFAF